MSYGIYVPFDRQHCAVRWSRDRGGIFASTKVGNQRVRVVPDAKSEAKPQAGEIWLCEFVTDDYHCLKEQPSVIPLKRIFAAKVEISVKWGEVRCKPGQSPWLDVYYPEERGRGASAYLVPDRAFLSQVDKDHLFWIVEPMVPIAIFGDHLDYTPMIACRLIREDLETKEDFEFLEADRKKREEEDRKKREAEAKAAEAERAREHAAWTASIEKRRKERLLAGPLERPIIPAATPTGRGVCETRGKTLKELMAEASR